MSTPTTPFTILLQVRTGSRTEPDWPATQMCLCPLGNASIFPFAASCGVGKQAVKAPAAKLGKPSSTFMVHMMRGENQPLQAEL